MHAGSGTDPANVPAKRSVPQRSFQETCASNQPDVQREFRAARREHSSSERSEQLRFPVGLLMRSNSIGRVLGCYPRDGGSNPPFAAIVSRDLSPATVGGWECGEQRQVSGRNPACAGCAVVTRGDVESRRSLTGDARLSGCPGIHPAHVGNPESYLPQLARRVSSR